MSKILQLDRDGAKQDPEKHFHLPSDVLDEQALTLAEKRAVFKNWLELVDRRLEAASEGMPIEGQADAKDALLQRQINDCLVALNKELEIRKDQSSNEQD